MFKVVFATIGSVIVLVGIAYLGAYYLPHSKDDDAGDYLPPSVLTMNPESDPHQIRKLPMKIEEHVA